MLPFFDDDLFLPGPCSHFTSLEAGVQFTVVLEPPFCVVQQFYPILPHSDKPRMVSKCAHAQKYRVRPDQSSVQRKTHHRFA